MARRIASDMLQTYQVHEHSQECAAGEHSLARMQCFHRFQQLVAEGVDHWCRHSNVTEVPWGEAVAVQGAVEMLGCPKNRGTAKNGIFSSKKMRFSTFFDHQTWA